MSKLLLINSILRFEDRWPADTESWRRDKTQEEIKRDPRYRPPVKRDE